VVLLSKFCAAVVASSARGKFEIRSQSRFHCAYQEFFGLLKLGGLNLCVLGEGRVRSVPGYLSQPKPLETQHYDDSQLLFPGRAAAR
jgi:hypothetical protein